VFAILSEEVIGLPDVGIGSCGDRLNLLRRWSSVLEHVIAVSEGVPIGDSNSGSFDVMNYLHGIGIVDGKKATHNSVMPDTEPCHVNPDPIPRKDWNAV
jgi:hypothetical protein